MNPGEASELTTRHGLRFALRDWPALPSQAPRAQVLLVHGLGEHVGRYAKLAEQLNEWGFPVRGYDQHGHGQSEGERGSLPSSGRLLEDLSEVVDATRARIGPDTPLVLLGHSLGGLVAASFVARELRAVDSLVLSSPALDAGLNPLQKILVAILPRLLPDLRVGNGLNPKFLSHDEEVVRAYGNDALVHDRISARLARFIAEEGAMVIEGAALWTVPTLLLYAGEDRLVSPAGSRDFAARAPASLVRTYGFETLYHEIFNEADARPVFAALKSWLDTRYPA